MSVTYEDLVAVWGEGNVVRVPTLGAEFSELPADARRVLSQVGLPEEVEYFSPSQAPNGWRARGVCGST